MATLNEYLGTMTDIILRWDGTLDKFIGDAIVVFWGAPLASEFHVEKGCQMCSRNVCGHGRTAEKIAKGGQTAT